MRFIELSHRIVPGMQTYPDLPVPELNVVMDYDASRPQYDGRAEFYIASLRLCGNTGTYVDAPIHRYRGGADLAALPIDGLAHVPVVMVRCREQRAIGPEAFRGLMLRDRAVLVDTGWSERWRTPHYFEPNPHLTGAACDLLVDAAVRFVGIDSVNIDDMANPDRPAHTKLLGAGIPICEHMTNLAEVPEQGGFLHAVPIAWVGGASFPVRAYVLAD